MSVRGPRADSSNKVLAGSYTYERAIAIPTAVKRNLPQFFWKSNMIEFIKQQIDEIDRDLQDIEVFTEKETNLKNIALKLCNVVREVVHFAETGKFRKA